MEENYLNALRMIMDTGTIREDRTGVGTKGVFGLQMRFDLANGFPAITTKKLAWKSVVSELLWFIEGSGDERRLAEILHGTRDPSKSTIWTANANADYWKPKAQFEGDLGRVYGTQWRKWRTINNTANEALPEFKVPNLLTGNTTPLYPIKEIDQLANLIEGIKKDPYGRRHILTAWNPGELDQMALPPCHAFCQFYVSGDKLSVQLYQRSADMFLGVPFNIASYSLFLAMIAQVVGLKPGELVHTIGDAHIYTNHIAAVEEQLSRTPYNLPLLWLNPQINNIDGFTMQDVKLEHYTSHPTIKADMAV